MVFLYFGLNFTNIFFSDETVFWNDQSTQMNDQIGEESIYSKDAYCEMNLFKYKCIAI